MCAKNIIQDISKKKAYRDGGRKHKTQRTDFSRFSEIQFGKDFSRHMIFNLEGKTIMIGTSEMSRYPSPGVV